MAEPLITTLLYRQGAMEMTCLFEDEQAPPDTARQEGEPAVALKALTSQHPVSGPCSSALPAAEVMLMVLNLPATLPREIEGMVQLQAEEISPFPAERTCVAWELLEQQDQFSRVLMGLCARKPLDQLHDLYHSAGLVPDRVDIDVLGWLALIKDAGELTDSADCLLLIIQDGHSDVVAWQKGQPCLIRSLVKASELNADTLHEELMMVMLSLSAAFDPAATQTLHIWHDGEAPGWLSEPGDWTFELHPLSQLPPLSAGLARRAMEPHRLDLSPPAWRMEKIRLKNRKKYLQIGIASAAVWVAVMLGFLGWSTIRQSGLRSLEKQNQATANEVSQIEALSQRVRSLTQFTDRSSSALETLLILASAAPGSGRLTIDDYRYDKTEGIVFSGSSGAETQPFYQFLEDLSAGELLRVKSYDLKESRNTYTFQVEAVWSWIDPDNGEEGS